MLLHNDTPYPHVPALLYDARGNELLSIVLKATFRLSDGAPHAAPLPVFTSDVLFASGALRYPADLAPDKQGTDVICNGHVYAPRGERVPACVAELHIADVRREVHATGPRRTPDADPEPFQRIPLGLDHAPGLAALAPHAEPRRRHRGTYDDTWQRTRAPLPPEDLDVRFWNAAQLTTARPLVGSEPIELVHLHPRGRLETSLPRISVRARIDDRDHRPALDRVLIEPDEDRLAVTLRVSFTVTGRLDRLPKVRLFEKRCVPLGRSR